MIEKVSRLNYEGERQFFLVHPYDGIYREADLQGLETVIKKLIKRVNKPFDYIIGLDGPAQIPAVITSMVSGKPLRVATKADLDSQTKIKFEEPGSPRPMFLYDIIPGDVLLVDDEIRTGRTIIACVEAIQHIVNVAGVIVPIGSTKHNLRKLFRGLGLKLEVEHWYDY